MMVLMWGFSDLLNLLDQMTDSVNLVKKIQSNKKNKSSSQSILKMSRDVLLDCYFITVELKNHRRHSCLSQLIGGGYLFIMLRSV